MSIPKWWKWEDDLEILKERLRNTNPEDVVKNVIGPFAGKFEFLSNFFVIPGGMKFMGYEVPTSEHAYQMMKTLDLADRAWIASQPTAALAKKAGSKNGLNGRKIELRPDWDDVRIPMMTLVVIAKFTQHAGLAKMLLDTGAAPLFELNWWGDNFWGWCVKTNGQNHLGIILEEVRNLLRKISLKL